MNRFFLIASIYMPISFILTMDHPITEIALTNYKLDSSKDPYLTIINESPYQIDFFHKNKAAGIIEYYRKNPERPHDCACPVQPYESLKFPILGKKKKINHFGEKDSLDLHIDYYLYFPLKYADKKTWRLHLHRNLIKPRDVVHFKYNDKKTIKTLLIETEKNRLEVHLGPAI